MQNLMIQSDLFTLEELYYIPMGEQNPVYSRPFMVSDTGSAVDDIAYRMAQSGSGKVTANIIGDVVGNLIQPSVVPTATVVDQSWVTTPRYVFLLKVKSVDAVGTQIYSYIQGYTEYSGINEATGSIDLELRHFINHIIETTVLDFQSPTLGYVRKEKLYRIYNVFSSQEHDLYTQRPTDVLEQIKVSNALAFMDGAGGSISGETIGNHVNPFNRAVLGSCVDNNITSDYICKILNAGVQEHKNRSIYLNSYEIESETGVGAITLEPNISDNRFVKYLSRLAGFKTDSNIFNFNQLMAIDSTIYTRFNLLKISKNYMDPLALATPDNGDWWTGQDPVTLKAYSLIESSVALATKYGFSKLFFTVSNMASPTAGVQIVITKFSSFIALDNQDYQYLLEIFKNKYISDIFLAETMGGTIPLHADVYVDLAGTSKINLSYGGFPENWYTIPTSANSLFSPVITADQNTLDAVSNRFSSLIEEISSSSAKQQNNIYY